jgi:hypothetical protein
MKIKENSQLVKLGKEASQGSGFKVYTPPRTPTTAPKKQLATKKK